MEKPLKLVPGTALYCINQWAIARKNEVLLTSLLSASGNSFSLNAARLGGEKLHVYIGYDGEELCLYTIPSDEDKGAVSNGSLAEISIPQGKNTIQSSPNDSSNRKELIVAINNWTNPANVAAWISQSFSANESGNNILQTFIIDTTDFMRDYHYQGYFALKITTGAKEQPVYTIDLVVVNTDTGEILNLVEVGETTHYRDLARLVPPFGQEGHSSTDQNNFGVLQTLEVQ